MNNRLVYVAGPISKGDVAANVALAHAAGLSVIVPHGSAFWGNKVLPLGSHSAFVPEASPEGTTHEMWLRCDLEIVRRCDAVLRLPGESRGADMEVAHAADHGIPVYRSVEDIIDVYVERIPYCREA